MNTSLLMVDAVSVPAIIGLVEVAKQMGLPTQFCAALAVAFGVLDALGQMYASQLPWVPAVMLGVSLGLSAAGGYDLAIRPAINRTANQTPPTP